MPLKIVRNDITLILIKIMSYWAIDEAIQLHYIFRLKMTKSEFVS